MQICLPQVKSYFKDMAKLIVLRLPFYFIADQINNILEEFLSSVNLNELENAVTIVELGRYRIRR